MKPGSLQWGLGIAGFTTNEEQDFCRYAGRKTFNQLRALLYSNIWHITEEILGLTQSHSMKVIELRAWYLDWTTKPADTCREINLELTKESFDKFLGEVNIKDLKQQEAQPSAPLSDMTIQKSTTHVATNLPMQNQTGNFKVDTRDIPTLPKKGNVADAFLKWDHLFCSKMQLAMIGELLNKSYTTPDKAKEPNAYHVHETKDNYLKLCLIAATTSTNAYPYIMDMSLTGHGAYFALKTAFQGDDYNQRRAEKALHTLYGLSFGPKSNMTADGYVAEFLTQVNIIAECGDPISESALRTLFLRQVTHLSFKTWKQIERSKEGTAVSSMKDLYLSFGVTASDVLLVTRAGTGMRHIANQKSSNDNKKTYTLSSSDKETIEKALTNGTNIPKTLWKKKSCKDQVVFCGKRRAKRNGAPDNTSVTSPLPSQYNQAHHSQVLQDGHGNCYKVIVRPEPKEESSTSTISSNSSNLQCATQMVKWTANIVSYKRDPRNYYVCFASTQAKRQM